MENEEKKLQPHMGRKALSTRNRIFLDKLADGVPVVDAYRLAGYTGSNHTAYELRRQLKQELRDVLEARGFSMEGVASEILALSKMPLNMALYKDGIPLSQKIQILKLFAQTLKDEAPKQSSAVQNVTAFIVSRSPGAGARVNVVDTTASPTSDVDQPDKGKP